MRHTGRKQKSNSIKGRRGAIKGRISIDKRPEIVEARSRIGGIEVDLMMGSNHKSALLVITDRATLITMIDKLKSKNAEEIYEKMSNRLTNFNFCWIKTITFDNGKEFAQHHQITKDLKVKNYFTRPYISQDKGIVENKIGVIGRFFPKKTDLREATVKRIKEVEKLLNYRLIRKFNIVSSVLLMSRFFMSIRQFDNKTLKDDFFRELLKLVRFLRFTISLLIKKLN